MCVYVYLCIYLQDNLGLEFNWNDKKKKSTFFQDSAIHLLYIIVILAGKVVSLS